MLIPPPHKACNGRATVAPAGIKQPFDTANPGGARVMIRAVPAHRLGGGAHVQTPNRLVPIRQPAARHPETRYTLVYGRLARMSLGSGGLPP